METTSTSTDPSPTSSDPQLPPSAAATSDPSPPTEPQSSPLPPSNPNPNPPQTLEQAPHPQPPSHQRPSPQPSIPRPWPPSQPINRVAIGVPANFQTSRPQNPSTSPFSSSSSFRALNPPSYIQPFAAMPRSSVGGPDSSPAQARQPVPGVQTIGMIGSLSTPSTSSQLRPSGTFGQNQQRLGPPQIRSITPSANQALNSQRFPSHVGPRGPSITSPVSQSSIPQGAQSLQQQWMSAQGKQTNVSLPSSSYRPQIRPQAMQQRQQHSLPMTSHHLQVPVSQQQQQKQHQLQQHTQQQQQQNPQSVPPQHQAARAIALSTPKPDVQTVVQHGLATSNPSDDGEEISNDIISRKRIRELVTQVDSSEVLRPEIEDDLLEIADDFIESIVTAACQLAKHRKSTTLEAKDILLHVERHWNITLPGFSGDEIKCYKKPTTDAVHKERLAMIKKSMAGTNDGANTSKTPAAGGQAATNPKLHATKTPAMGE